MRLELGLNVNMKLSQQLRLAPQIIQSIEILQLPAMDLRELIENELQENEALEVLEPAPDAFQTDEKERSEVQEEDGSFEDDAERVLERLDGLLGAERGAGYQSRGAAQEASDRKLEAMQNAPAYVGSLSDQLMPQLEEMELSGDVRRAAEAIVLNLSDTGLLECSLEDVSDGMDVPPAADVMVAGLRVVQTLEPRGVGARDLRECLLLQIPNGVPSTARSRGRDVGGEVDTGGVQAGGVQAGGVQAGGVQADGVQAGGVQTGGVQESPEGSPEGGLESARRNGSAAVLRDELAREEDDNALKRTLIRDHYEDLKRNKLPRVAKAMGIEMPRLYEIMHGLSSLSTRPGASYSAVPTRYIRPDVVIEWEDGEYLVRLVNDHLPRVGLSGNVRRMLEDARKDKKVREYLKRKIDSAKWLIEAIAQRQSTLERVVKEIVSRQRDYLDFGVSHLRPLKMQEIADVLGIHVSTVSRAISEKYAQTPRGIIPLKFFFTGGTENESGGIESRLSVKERVRELIDDEDKHSPLSDDEVAERLKNKYGLEIARRTVTKYRKALNIPSSRQRRMWV